jgi:hypothetical protein
VCNATDVYLVLEKLQKQYGLSIPDDIIRDQRIAQLVAHDRQAAALGELLQVPALHANSALAQQALNELNAGHRATCTFFFAENALGMDVPTVLARDEAVRLRMLQLGVPEHLCGIPETDPATGHVRRIHFDPRATEGGASDVEPGTRAARGICVDRGVDDRDLLRNNYNGASTPAWDAATVDVRTDAIILHEFLEATSQGNHAQAILAQVQQPLPLSVPPAAAQVLQEQHDIEVALSLGKPNP